MTPTDAFLSSVDSLAKAVPTDRLATVLTEVTTAFQGSHDEAILKLRALRANGDFEEHWRYHRTQERHRVHKSRYLNNLVPLAA